VRLFDLQIEDLPEGTRARFSGEIDMSAIDELWGRLRPVVERSPAIVVADLTGVTFLDSSGLRLMLKLQAQLAEQDCRLVVVPGGDRVARVFQLTGAEQELDIAAPGQDPLDSAPTPD
jgi:anti-anti-sigma factor